MATVLAALLLLFLIIMALAALGITGGVSHDWRREAGLAGR